MEVIIRLRELELMFHQEELIVMDIMEITEMVITLETVKLVKMGLILEIQVIIVQ